MSENQLKPLPPALPASRALWHRQLKRQPGINDYVESIHLMLLEDEDEEVRERYNRFLYATWDEQAIEGSQAADNLEAANMIREKAKEVNPKHALIREKKTTIAKALNVVLKRYGQSRSERRNRIGGPVDPINPEPEEE